MRALRELRNTGEVIDVLGGNRAVVDFIKSKTKRIVGSNHVSNWRATGYFPTFTYLIFANELGRLGYSAPPGLWRIDPDKSLPAPRLNPKRIPARASS